MSKKFIGAKCIIKEHDKIIEYIPLQFYKFKDALGLITWICDKDDHIKVTEKEYYDFITFDSPKHKAIFRDKLFL